MIEHFDLFILFYSIFITTYLFVSLSLDLYTLCHRKNEIVPYIKSLNVVFYNIFFMGPIYFFLYTYVLLYGFTIFPSETVYIYSFNSPFNLFYELINVIVSLICAEIFFYFSHRLFHSNKYLYKTVHKLHHTYSISTYGIHAQYCSKFELITNLITATLGSMLVHHHIITIILQSIVMIIINVIGHTTNEFKIFGKTIYSTKEHNDHHLLLNVNYGLLTICDKTFGTYKK